MVESERDTGGKVTLERRYYLSSLDNQAARFAQAVRGALGDRKLLALVISSFSITSGKLAMPYR
jgi:hypothetical protein